MTTNTTQLNALGDNVDITTINGEEIIDFDIAANSNYEIQSCVMVDENDNVVEAAVRFGRIETHDDMGIGKPILHSAWTAMTANVIGPHIDNGGSIEYEADLSDFKHIVPHLRVRRENVEEFGFDTMSLAEFVSNVAELAELVETVFRADKATIDREIDHWL